MTPLVWANFPLALIFILAWSAIPLRMVVKRPDTPPDFSSAHAYLAAKARLRGRGRSGAGQEHPGRASAAVAAIDGVAFTAGRGG